ncbi:LacI family transcriptional regulator [Cellulomonas soli]|uniref:LacI family transcriptional regulator n=2 Tax=Cellulomonas soli TaxID=931535 RepID=A0A512P8U8_9CELL|nr:LacI family transcriptional regulator [Cellulomonas soli]
MTCGPILHAMTTRTGAGRAPRFGVALQPTVDDRGLEPFYTDFLAGVEEELDRSGATVLLHVVHGLDDELAAYRRWARDGLVDAVVAGDLVEDDPRAAFCADLGLPLVLIGGEPGCGASVVDYDNGGAMRTAVAFLADLGHRRIGRVSGPARYAHTRARDAAFGPALAELGAQGVQAEGDYGEASGAAATRTLLQAPEPPTALVYDNDVMAVAGLAVAAELGVDVPGRLSVLAWDDSANCRLSHPPLSVVSRDVHEVGQDTARLLLRLAAGAAPEVLTTPGVRVVARGTTGPAPRA